MTTSDIALLIRMEHRNFASLLDILDQQLGLLDREGALDYDLIEALLDYFLSYAAQCHHPKEDLVYRKLEARESAATDSLSNLVEEHEELDRITGRLAEQVRAARGKGRGPSERLESGLRRFLDFYRRHMAMEEKYFLAAAERVLTADDWEEIEFDLFDKSDPVFDEETEHRYQGLRERIFATEAGESQASRSVPAAIEAAASDTMTLAAFNSMLEARGESARLSRVPDGGFRLTTPDAELIAIPELGETEAVRCATYFLKGRGRLS